ncbi:MAG: DUF3426 domain-containing protein [Thermodesulfobacteriota bacterium]
MIVQCERCQTKFKLDDERVPEGGAKARCSKCQHTFAIVKPTTTPGIGTTGQLKGENEGVKSGRFPLKSMVALLVLFVVVGGGVFLYWDKLVEINWKIFSMSNLRDYLGSRISPDENTILPKFQIRGYYIDNINVGRIFVIEGKAINNSSEAKGFIKVKGALFDSMGNKLAEREVFCGNILSKEELMKLEADQIDSCLNNPAGEFSINQNVPPQKSIPFMVVFFDLPEGLKEFRVSVVRNQELERHQFGIN